MAHTGRVLFGSNNIYSVSAGGLVCQCRIKGKVLRAEPRAYNPIAAGDEVEIEPDPLNPGTGWILGRGERRTSLVRWNKQRLQVLAANADCLLAVASTQSPPFRPRFVDRLFVSGAAGGLEAVLAVNKCDLGLDPGIRDRLAAFRRAGYRVIECSALTGQGAAELQALLQGKTTVFAGQSGAGKSSLLNLLVPGLELTVGELSTKYDRGVHTTSFARLFPLASGGAVIDTPGVREFALAGIRPGELAGYFPEFLPLGERCAVAACLHRAEPGCAVREAADAEAIHPDRYESYLRIQEDLIGFAAENYGRARA